MLLEDLALGVVADVHDVDETAQISFLGLNWAMAAVYWVFDGWRRRPAVQKLLRRIACQEVWYGGSETRFMRRAAKRRRRRRGK